MGLSLKSAWKPAGLESGNNSEFITQNAEITNFIGSQSISEPSSRHFDFSYPKQTSPHKKLTHTISGGRAPNPDPAPDVPWIAMQAKTSSIGSTGITGLPPKACSPDLSPKGFRLLWRTPGQKATNSCPCVLPQPHITNSSLGNICSYQTRFLN